MSGWHGSGKISAFEGSSERGETTEENAVREFTEESMGMLGDPAALRTELEGGDFAIRINVRDAFRNEEHVTFVKRFEWPSDTVERFAERRRTLMGLQGLTSRFSDLERSVPNTYPFFRHGDQVHMSGQMHRIVGVRAKMCGDYLHVRLAAQTDEASFRSRRFRYGPVSGAAHRYAEMHDLLRRMREALASLPSGMRRAVRFRRHATGDVSDVAVREEWLEKMCVQEVTLDQLHVDLQRNRHLFRPFFLVVIRQAIGQFHLPSPPHSNVLVNNA